MEESNLKGDKISIYLTALSHVKLRELSSLMKENKSKVVNRLINGGTEFLRKEIEQLNRDVKDEKPNQ